MRASDPGGSSTSGLHHTIPRVLQPACHTRYDAFPACFVLTYESLSVVKFWARICLDAAASSL